MSLDATTFQTIIPCRYITFAIPNPLLHLHYFLTPHLRIAILDSPLPPSITPIEIAAMLVPINRESDWIFSTEQGHLQLLLTFPHLSRLIIIGNSSNSPNPTSFITSNCVLDSSVVEQHLLPLLIALTPKSAFCQTHGGLPEIPFLSYEDEVVRSLVLDTRVGPFVGEMLIEDVELGNREFRRRLRFKRTPNLVQTQIRIRPKDADFVDMEGVEFEVDNDDDGVLVHPYLTPMVAGLSLITSRDKNETRPKALCLGVGGGALLRFLSSQLGFLVLGVEVDPVVLQVARTYFGLEHVHLCSGDAIEMIEKIAHGCSDLEGTDFLNGKFDVIMVDLDSRDSTSAPPLEFVHKSVLLATKALLSKHGVVIINVIPSHQSSYNQVIASFRQVFVELYEIDVGNGENFVLIASTLQIRPVSSHHHESKFHNKLKQVSGTYADSIRMI